MSTAIEWWSIESCSGTAELQSGEWARRCPGVILAVDFDGQKHKTDTIQTSNKWQKIMIIPITESLRRQALHDIKRVLTDRETIT
ncbi:hypothetical protein IMCC3135_32780 [Granulosicoccus antarcticus IMCC3135]|uniref:Uncharacterized protein n=1 Tax=Granulosicoccus antarcticus IMCC3135 TaxID=1192854 RepID=A0A2Z2P204_9GAMM|nr:hypothetical protein IMCC3135_32780 [Granulosicoccus antarcticus IMCC3135]